MKIIKRTIKCNLCEMEVHKGEMIALGDKQYICSKCYTRIYRGTFVRVDVFGELEN